MEEQLCCGTCHFNHYYKGDFVCSCEESENFGLETDYGDYCDEWEDKKDW